MFESITKKLKKKYKNNEYVIFMHIEDNTNLLLMYNKTMINIDLLQKSLIPSLIKESITHSKLDETNIVGIKEISERDIDSALFSGSIIIYNYTNKSFYSINADNIPTRSTSDPINDISIVGARDALVESNEKNVALIQKRIKSNELRI